MTCTKRKKRFENLPSCNILQTMCGTSLNRKGSKKPVGYPAGMRAGHDGASGMGRA